MFSARGWGEEGKWQWGDEGKWKWGEEGRETKGTTI